MADTKQQVQELTNKLEQGVKDLFASDVYADYLKTMSRFHRYSTRNTLLIHLQYPNATLVSGFSAWQTKFNRHVKKGEKAIKILAPIPLVMTKETEKLDAETGRPIIGEDGEPVREEIEIKTARFKIVNVFDAAQTEGEPLPTLAQDLTGNVEQYEAFMDALREASPLPIVFEDLPDNMDGICHYGDRIAIREGMSELQTVCAVIHEMTHEKLHDLEALRLINENAEPKDRRTEEIEAESAAFCVCAYFNLDTGANSFGYISEYSRGRELKELNASLDTIRKTAAEMIDAIDGRFQEIAKERDIAFVIGEQQANLSEPETELPVAASAERVSPNAVYARYCNQIVDMVKKNELQANAVLNNDEQNARTECEEAVKRVVMGLYAESDEHADLFRLYTENPNFRERIDDYVFMRTYLEPQTAKRNAVNETPAFVADISDATDLIAEYARNAQVSDPQRVGSVVLMTPVFDDMNFNRAGKKIRVTVEETAGKYQIYSRVEHEQKMYYFLTASGRIDRLDGYFNSVWNEQTQKRESYLPTEADIDEVIPKIAERFENDMADPTKWTLYQHAAVLNRIDDCEAHNIPVRELRDTERKSRSEAAEQARFEEQQRRNSAENTEVRNTVEDKLYEKFAELFPQFAKGDYSYMRLEAGAGFMPLSLEYIFGDRISVMHTYELNGDKYGSEKHGGN